jgi:hypothetical protein
MAKLLSEINKVDIAIVPASINGASTGAYYNLGLRNKALFVWETGAMAAAATSIGQVMQAKDAAGTDAEVVTNNAATITANTKVAAATLTVDTVVATNKVTINGLTFEAAAAADLANRNFAVGVDNAGCAASLAAAINHATAGVPGVTASAAQAVVTLTSTEPGEVTITITDATAVRIVPATLRAIGYVECDTAFLKDGFNYVALRITNSAAAQTGAVLVRGENRYSPLTNQVAAAKVDVEP